MRRVVVAAVSVATLMAVLYLLVIRLPEGFAVTEGLSANEAREEVGRVRTAMLGMIAGVIAGTGALLTTLTYRLNRRVADQTHERDREGQITERFTRAIDQIGHDKLDVRLGGIYALERIARDSVADHPQVVEVLTAYIREHARREAKDDLGEPDLTTTVDTDVQAALTVLARRETDDEYEPGLPNLNLARTDLCGARLAGAMFDGVDLSSALLTRTDFRHAGLQGAFLSMARMDQAFLDGADLRGATLRASIFTDADLTGARLGEARMQSVKLLRATLARADLTRTNLQTAKLHGANLTEARLHRANLQQVDAREANFSGADLTSANVLRADLSQADLTGADLRGAIFDDETKWPDSLDPVARGATRARRRRPGA